MEAFLKILNWKKWVIATILTATAWFIYAKWYVDDVTYAFVCTILATLFGTASYQTHKMYK